jgi:carboxypeptidase PM20D1
VTELILIALALVFVLMGINTIRFKQKTSFSDPIKPSFDENHAIESMKKMIQFKTISNQDIAKINRPEFEAFKGYLVDRYPHINKHATCILIEPLGIIYHIKGAHHDNPSVLMSHYDVVPENGTWEDNPFLGELKEDYIYGRGTLDTKGTLCAIMESVEHHLNEGLGFNQDLYLCFGGDEEVYGKSAENIVSYFEEKGIRLGFVLDEGGAVVEKPFPGIKDSVAMIGLVEKGVLSLSLTVKSSGGHAAIPPKETAITILSKAVTKLNRTRTFNLTFTEVPSRMFKTLASHSESLMIRFIFSNLWLFEPLVKLMAKKDGKEMLSFLKTTQAFTMMKGSQAINVLPTEASIGINYRLLPGQTTDQVIKRVQKIIGDDRVDIKTAYAMNPPRTSPMDESYHKITKTVSEIFPHTISAPYLMMATTDSRHYDRVSNHVYRFSPIRMSKEARASIHSVNEKIHKDHFIECVAFYINLLKKL